MATMTFDQVLEMLRTKAPSIYSIITAKRNMKIQAELATKAQQKKDDYDFEKDMDALKAKQEAEASNA